MKPHPSTDSPAPKPPMMRCRCGQPFTSAIDLVKHVQTCKKAEG